MALHHVPDLDALLRSVAGLLVDGGRLASADLDEDPDGAFHADLDDFAQYDAVSARAERRLGGVSSRRRLPSGR
jgi:hypothetical protein